MMMMMIMLVRLHDDKNIDDFQKEQEWAALCVDKGQTCFLHHSFLCFSWVLCQCSCADEFLWILYSTYYAILYVHRIQYQVYCTCTYLYLYTLTGSKHVFLTSQLSLLPRGLAEPYFNAVFFSTLYLYLYRIQYQVLMHKYVHFLLLSRILGGNKCTTTLYNVLQYFVVHYDVASPHRWHESCQWKTDQWEC